MSKLGDEKTINALKKLREGIDGLITLYEKDEGEVTEVQLEAATGKFMIAIMGMDALK